MGDVFTITVAVVIFVAVARRIRPIHWITVFFLALLTGAWIWANLRDTGWQEVWNEVPPDGLDPVTRAMYWRGWPLAPFMFCVIHGNRMQRTGIEGPVLVFDWLVLFVVLYLARLACERCFRSRAGRTRHTDALPGREDVQEK